MSYPVPKFAAVSRSLGFTCAVLVLAGGTVSALGWIADIPRLNDWDGNGISTKFNTSVCLTLAGTAVLLAVYHPRYSLAVRCVGGSLALIAAATLSQTILALNYGIDTLFFSDEGGAIATVSPGRMGPPASSSFILIGTALIFSTIERTRHLAAWMSLAVLLIVSTSISGYAFGADVLYTLPTATGIALQTALMLAIGAIGLLAAIPDRGLAAALLSDDAGGVMLRRSLPFTLLGVWLLTWLVVYGTNARIYDVPFAGAIMIATETAILIAVLVGTARYISESERLKFIALEFSAARAIAHRNVKNQEAERKRLARDLHDQIGQEVTGVRLSLERLCREKLETTELVAGIKNACENMKGIDAQLSTIAWQLRPPEIDADGFIPALRRLGAECAAIHNIRFDLHAPPEMPGLGSDVEAEVFRIVQEAINNTVKHAEATLIAVTLDHRDGCLRVTIEDDGNGEWDPDAELDGACGGFGIIGMRERTALIKGELEIEAVPTSGTTIFLRVPSERIGHQATLS